jgi:quercetin dioxygenase-like cupin family protein
MSHHSNIWFALTVATVVLNGCNNDNDNDSGVGGSGGGVGGAGSECVADTDATIEGTAMAVTDFAFRNAFDPSDQTVYDPDDAASLPAPVMVDAWGDRSMGSHGTLGVFPPGFSAPLHTHSEAYDGVVLRGNMTNPFGTDLEVFLDGDDTNDHGSEILGPGSYWHVPAGSQHTTTCLGPEVCWFYFHAEAGFDFAPFVDDMGALTPGTVLEAPHPEAVLLPNASLAFAEAAPFVSFAPAWGDMASGQHGSFGSFVAGAASPVHVHGAEYYGVVISGELTNPFNYDNDPKSLTRGGYWSVPADAVHVTACAQGEDCLFYFHQRTSFDFTPLCEQP